MKKRVSVQAIELDYSPFQVAEQLVHCDGLIFMDSSGNLPENYNHPLSIIAVEPKKTVKGKRCKFSKLRKILAKYKPSKSNIPDYIPQGGAFGWVDYEGDFCFGIYKHCLVYDHNEAQWYEIGNVLKRMRPPEKLAVTIGEFTSNMSRKDYIDKVNAIQKYIRAGDIYQVNLTQKFTNNYNSGNLFALYATLRKSAPAPMSAYIKLGGREILSSSPETFLSFQGRKVVTRPIKGTRPRFLDPAQDKASAKELVESAKENAELVMITDLERNDLGQVCEYGSVRVEEMLKLETLEHVFHLVSKVRGTIREEFDHMHVLKACFPGGSITGAPKKRAMEIIEELEQDKRGLYTGAIGYFGIGGASQFNIVIRTLVKENGVLHYHVGAGIVADSVAEDEYDETLHKARGMQNACEKHR